MNLCLSSIALAALVLGPGDEERIEDFEEAPPAEAIVAGWQRVASPHHPAWNRIERVRDPKDARSGEHYLRMTSLGGSTALEMQKERAWKVEPGHFYRLSALAKLKVAKRNIATLTAIWLDGNGAALSETASHPISGQGEWRELALDLPAPPESAAAIAIRLSFDGEDLAGECWFDRLVLRRPAIIRLFPAEGNLPVVAPKRPSRFHLLGKQLPRGTRGATFLWRDPEGHERILDREIPIKDGSPLGIDLPALEPGAHALTARLSAPDGRSIEREWTILVPERPWLVVPGQKPLVAGAFDPSIRTYPHLRELIELAGFRRARVAIGRGDPAAERELVLELNRMESMTVVGEIDRPSADEVRRYREFVPLWQRDQSIVKADDLLKNSEGERAMTIDSRDPAELLRRIVKHAADGTLFVPMDRLLDADGFPTAGFLVLRAANDILPGATPRPDLVSLLGAPVRAAFEKGGRAILVLWSEPGESEFTPGFEAESFRPLGSIRRHAAGERLRVGAMPIFLGNIDPSLLERRVSLRVVDPSDVSAPGNLIPLGDDPSTRVLRIRNRSRKSALTDFRARIVEPLPRGWVVRPMQSADLSIAPGRELDHELAILLPRNEEEGERTLDLELRFVQDGRSHTVREKLALRVVPQIDLDVQVSEAPGMPDAKRVTVRVFNRSARPMTLVATVRLPDRPEQSEPLGTLEPKSSADRTLDYLIRDVRLIDPTRLKVEVLCEERTGDRRHARKLIPLK